jgi:hypothetical protein
MRGSRKGARWEFWKAKMMGKLAVGAYVELRGKTRSTDNTPDEAMAIFAYVVIKMRKWSVEKGPSAVRAGTWWVMPDGEIK